MLRPGAIAAFSLIAVSMVGAAVAWVAGVGLGIPPPRLEASAVAGDKTKSPKKSLEMSAVLEAAIRRGDVEAISRYLADGADPNGLDAKGERLLNKAVLSGNPAIVRALLDAGADPDLPGRNGLAALAIAALAGQRTILDGLLEHRAVHSEGTDDPVFSGRQGGPAPSSVTDNEALDPPHSGTNEDARRTMSPVPRVAGPPAAIPPGPPPDALPGGTDPARSANGPVVADIEPAFKEHASAPPPGALGSAGQPVTVPPPRSLVASAQKHLKELGYDPGPADGMLGSRTVAAVRAYQERTGSRVDGAVSAQLVGRLEASVAAQRPARMNDTSGPATKIATPALRPPSKEADRAPGESEREGLAEVLAKFQKPLGQDFNSVNHPEVIRQYCQQNTGTWIYDEGAERYVFCRDIAGTPPR